MSPPLYGWQKVWCPYEYFPRSQMIRYQSFWVYIQSYFKVTLSFNWVYGESSALNATLNGYVNICNNEFMGVNLFLYCSDHKGVMSLGHFTHDSADTVNLRGSDLPVGSANWPELQGNDLLSCCHHREHLHSLQALRVPTCDRTGTWVNIRQLLVWWM